jgi:inner membrane protein
MATPYGHTLAGLSLFNLWYSRTNLSNKKGVLVYGLIALIASFPDLDFIPGLILGQGERFHHGYSHSLGMVFTISLIVVILFKLIESEAPLLKTGGFVFSLILSHLFLDYITEAPKGFPLFWPFTETNALSSLPILPRVERNIANPEILSQALFCFSVESFLLLPLWAASLSRKDLRK